MKQFYCLLALQALSLLVRLAAPGENITVKYTLITRTNSECNDEPVQFQYRNPNPGDGDTTEWKNAPNTDTCPMPEEEEEDGEEEEEEDEVNVIVRRIRRYTHSLSLPINAQLEGNLMIQVRLFQPAVQRPFCNQWALFDLVINDHSSVSLNSVTCCVRGNATLTRGILNYLINNGQISSSCDGQSFTENSEVIVFRNRNTDVREFVSCKVAIDRNETETRTTSPEPTSTRVGGTSFPEPISTGARSVANSFESTGGVITSLRLTSTEEAVTLSELTSTGGAMTSSEPTSTGGVMTSSEPTSTGGAMTSSEPTSTVGAMTSSEPTSTGGVMTSSGLTSTGGVMTSSGPTSTGGAMTSPEPTSTGGVMTSLGPTSTITPFGSASSGGAGITSFGQPSTEGAMISPSPTNTGGSSTAVSSVQTSMGEFSMTISINPTSEVASTAFTEQVTTLPAVKETPTTSPDNRNNSTEAPISGQLTLEAGVLRNITGDETLGQILNLIEQESYLTALMDLQGFANLSREKVDLTAATYLLSAVVNDLRNETVEPAISELVLSIASIIVEIAQNRVEDEPTMPNDVAGSTLLQVLDTFALNNHNVSQQVNSTNIVFVVMEISANDTDGDRISPIENEDAEISIPREILEAVGNEEPVRMASFLFRNMSGLLPERLEDDNNTSGPDNDLDDQVFRLASPVISTSFNCDSCTTNLSTPVEITFRHQLFDQALLGNDTEGRVTCVFWEFNDTQQESSLLFRGQWSSKGCRTYFNSSTTVCQCDHLTHFAILLSARPLDLSRDKKLALQITGYIGVAISLVAMTATVLVFLFLKPLRTMRNYIHIQLCVTLGIAQIIFVAGVEPRLGEGQLVGGVPVGCRLVAVLIHYWFLVSFMWMLMEGVVLYVALVRVFVKHHSRYIAAFTVASYGIPLIYMGCLTLPLGFARTEEMRTNQTYDYGYEQACYLNPATSFIWSFITPVILILLANTGFFIMAIVIMQRHQRRQHVKNTKHKVRHWLKASISLTVVMGITWIIGVLVIEVDALFPLAYIFTIFVAFQGLFIFVIFVLLSKQVRENYTKWWKAKVAESDFLSRHFGEKSFTLGTTATKSSSSSSSQTKAPKAKDTELISVTNKSLTIENSYTDDKYDTLKSHDLSCDNESEGNLYTFDVVFVPLSTAMKSTEHEDSSILNKSSERPGESTWSRDRVITNGLSHSTETSLSHYQPPTVPSPLNNSTKYT